MCMRDRHILFYIYSFDHIGNRRFVNNAKFDIVFGIIDVHYVFAIIETVCITQQVHLLVLVQRILWVAYFSAALVCVYILYIHVCTVSVNKVEYALWITVLLSRSYDPR